MLMDNVYGSSEYNAFMQEMDNLGFPETRNIAITNGSLYGAKQDEYVLNQGAYFRFQGRRGQRVDKPEHLPVGTKMVQADLAIFPTKKGKPSISADISAYRKDKIWIIENLAKGNAPKTINSLSNAKEYDTAPGGYLEFSLKAISNTFTNMSDYVTIDHSDSFKFPFVPTYSSLAISSQNMDQSVNESDSPFDRIIGMGDGAVDDNNLFHARVIIPYEIYAELDEATKPVIKLDEKVVLWLHLPTTGIDDIRDVASCCLSTSRRNNEVLMYADDVDQYRKNFGFSTIDDLYNAKYEDDPTFTTPELIQAFRDHVKSLDGFLDGYTKEQCEADDKFGSNRELTHSEICNKLD